MIWMENWQLLYQVGKEYILKENTLLRKGENVYGSYNERKGPLVFYRVCVPRRKAYKKA